MKRSTFLICAVLLAACFFLWHLHRHQPKQAALPGADESPKSESPGVVHEDGGTRQQGARHQGAPENAVIVSRSVPPVLTDSNAALQQMLAQWQAPIDFYGKVLDENSNTVTGATIRFSWTERPMDDTAHTSTTESDSQGLFKLHGARGPSLDVRVSKQGYYTSSQDTWSFSYAISGRFLPDPANPVVFHLRTKGTPEPLMRVAGNGLGTMSDYSVSRDGVPTEVSLRDGRQMPAGEGDLRVEVWIGKPLDGFPSRLEWKCRVTVPGGGLVQVKDEFAFLAPLEGYQQADEWLVDGGNWAEKVQKRYYVKLPDGKFGLVTLRVIGVANPFFRLASLVNPSGSRNLEPAN